MFELYGDNYYFKKFMEVKDTYTRDYVYPENEKLENIGEALKKEFKEAEEIKDIQTMTEMIQNNNSLMKLLGSDFSNDKDFITSLFTAGVVEKEFYSYDKNVKFNFSDVGDSLKQDVEYLTFLISEYPNKLTNIYNPISFQDETLRESLNNADVKDCIFENIINSFADYRKVDIIENLKEVVKDIPLNQEGDLNALRTQIKLACIDYLDKEIEKEGFSSLIDESKISLSSKIKFGSESYSNSKNMETGLFNFMIDEDDLDDLKDNDGLDI